MLQPTSPSRGARGWRTRQLCLAALLAIPAVAAVCAALVRRGILGASAGIAFVALAALAAAVCTVVLFLRTAGEREHSLEKAEADRKRALADFECRTSALQQEIVERAKELESANASLRVATKVNALLALCAQHMPSGVIITDAKGLILWANQSWESLSGWSESASVRQPVDDVLGRVWNGFVPSEGRKIVNRGEATTVETHASGPDGSVRRLTIAFQPVRNPAQQVVNFIVIVEDVTAQREADLRLKTANDRLQLALRSSGNGIWETRMDSGQLAWDDRMYEIYGVSRAAFEGTIQGWYAMIHPEDLESVRAHRQQVLDGTTQNFDIDFRIVRPNGDIRHLEAHGSILKDGTGTPQCFVGLNRDITTRKKLEERLRHSEEISIQVSRIAQIGAWELRAADLELTWEPELFRIAEVELGYAPTLHKMAEFFVGIDQDMFLQAVQQAVQSGHSFDMEACPFSTALGRHRTVHVFGRAEFKDGRTVRIFGAVQDITVRHEAEEAQRKLELQLFQVQKMETLGTLAGGIAHDFNNLLTGIMGYNDLALDGLPEDHPARPCLKESRTACLRACELVEQILVFSRQPTGTERVPVDVAFIVDEARRFLRATVPATIQIDANVAPNCGRVLADATQLNQVLLNLGSNAAHAMRAGPGLMRITGERAELNETQAAVHGNLPAGAYLHLSVSDTGHGMDADTQARIFDPFFTTKEVGEGTGLGLAIVHGIVRAHGGAIEVDSTLGVGTTFHIYLPAAKGDSDKIDVAPAVPRRGAGEVVCVVDDEQLVAEATRLSLERFGYRPAVFNSSEECLKALRQEHTGCSLLLSDQTMPGMTGMELSTEVRKFAPNLPIIIMSGYFSKVSAGALEQIGRISLLAKPFTTSDLTQAVHRALHPDERG